MKIAPPVPPPDDGVVRIRVLRAGDAPAYAAAFADDPDLGSVILWHVDWEQRRTEAGIWLAPGTRGAGVGRGARSRSTGCSRASGARVARSVQSS